jgi:hypothetical protein
MAFKLAQFSTAEGAEHENTTTIGSIAKKTFAIGELMPGKVYGFECGVVVNDNNSTDTLTLGLTFGTNATTPGSNTAIASGGAVDVADADVGMVRGTIHVQSATRYVFHVDIADPDAVGTITLDNHGPVLFTAVANTAYTLDVSADWSVTHADNEVAAMSFAVWEIV